MRLNGFDLNQLVCLDALLRERNVSRAAETVHLSQSAMSWILAQLRDYFGDPLLVRSGRTLVLTPFAMTLVAPVAELLRSAQGLLASTPSEMQHQAERVLRVVASDYVLTAGLAAAVQQATVASSNLRIELLPLTMAAPRLLANGEIDLLFAGQALDVGKPPDQLAFEDQFTCVVCSRRGPRGKTLTPKSYLARRHIVLRYFEHQLTFEDEEALRRQGIARERRVSVWSHALVPSLLAGTDMIATVAERAAFEMVARWPLRKLAFPFSQDPIRTYAYWHGSRQGDQQLFRFLELSQQAFARKGADLHRKDARVDAARGG
ncbi:MAG: LysR family transcriptional regulator [Pseudomonadota bacterium]